MPAKAPSLGEPKFDWHHESDVRTADDNWSGLASNAERRKRQNRINARAARRRKGVESQKSSVWGSDRGSSSAGSSVDLSSTTPLSSFDDDHEDESRLAPAVPVQTSQKHLEIRNWRVAKALSNLSNDLWYQDIPFHSARLGWFSHSDLLPGLVSYNVLRGFLYNMKILGYRPIDLCSCELRSTFPQNIPAEALPDDLKPTVLQRTVPHHPVIDTIPDPPLRDQIILIEDVETRESVCTDLISKTREDDDSFGMILWGEPFKTKSWEVTETFYRNWHRLLVGSTELLESSDRWRKMRGEEALTI